MVSHALQTWCNCLPTLPNSTIRGQFVRGCHDLSWPVLASVFVGHDWAHAFVGDTVTQWPSIAAFFNYDCGETLALCFALGPAMVEHWSQLDGWSMLLWNDETPVTHWWDAETSVSTPWEEANFQGFPDGLVMINSRSFDAHHQLPPHQS